ncbi:ABC transporter substrate-binding protein [Amycolatopsis thermophila]|uniref:Peptide/nickel transport system substrate-binding protein n=1 Tax=Amycolatopsis thermophila TaxID=206084 RepID=A0ABU0F511_9PSEU|nr:ABC transporter substrate-binding protein [Amycolatopsis thermophila]MDQ0382670.1 peptide/nickel transport system substrate-binding protein [Amycolatopsis thermophila]
MIAVFSLLVAACGGPGGGASQPGALNRSATLKVAWSAAPGSLDPHHTPVPSAAFPYLAPVYDRLTRLAAGPEIEPMLATSWQFAPDGKSVEFKLRDGVTFSDGAPVDAAAVKASLDRARTPDATTRTDLAMVTSVDVVDPHTVRVSANRPADDLPAVLSDTAGSIISPRAIDSPDLAQHPVGSGPYQVTAVRSGDRVTYTRRDGYWDPDAQRTAGLEVVSVPDPNARLAALRSRQLDMVLTDLTQGPEVAHLGSGFSSHLFAPSRVYGMILNTSAPNLSDVRVRQALGMAVDRKVISETLMKNSCAPTTQRLAAPGSQGHVADLPDTPAPDLAGARALLAQAGVPSGFTMTVLVGTGLQPQNDLAVALQNQLGQIGVRLNIQPMEITQAQAKFGRGQADGLVHAQITSATPALTLRDNFLNQARFPGALPAGLADTVNQAFDPSLDAAARDRLLQQANRTISEQALVTFVCASGALFAYSNKVDGVEQMAHADVVGTFDVRGLGIRG